MTERRTGTRRDAAECLGYTERHIDRLKRAGKLKAFKVGHHVRFWMSDIMALRK